MPRTLRPATAHKVYYEENRMIMMRRVWDYTYDPVAFNVYVLLYNVLKRVVYLATYIGIKFSHRANKLHTRWLFSS